MWYEGDNQIFNSLMGRILRKRHAKKGAAFQAEQRALDAKNPKRKVSMPRRMMLDSALEMDPAKAWRMKQGFERQQQRGDLFPGLDNMMFPSEKDDASINARKKFLFGLLNRTGFPNRFM